MRTSQQKKVHNIQRNARGGHLIFPNEANFSPREAYPLMKISCKLVKLADVTSASMNGSATAEAKSKYPPDASGGYK